MLKVIAFVPARCGSKSILMKNIKLLAGKPLLYYTLYALQNAPSVNEVYVATDCDEIENCALNFSFSKLKVFRRSAENASDTASTESVMLEFIQHHEFSPEDFFILVQPTSPFTQSVHLEEALLIYKNENFDSLLTCSRWKRFLWNENGTPKNYDYMHRPRRQDFKGELVENGAFYISTIRNILQNKNRLSGKIGIYEMPEKCLLEIDEPQDWIAAEIILKKEFNEQ